MPSWASFEHHASDFAEAGRRLLIGEDGVAIAFLASHNPSRGPHLAPVCPIFCGDDLYLSATAKSPRTSDLRGNGAYALHAFLGANDEEFQISGAAAEVSAASQRTAVHAAIPFTSFDPEDPIFRLDVARALWVYWERVGQADTKAVRKRWRSTEQQ